VTRSDSSPRKTAFAPSIVTLIVAVDDVPIKKFAGPNGALLLISSGAASNDPLSPVGRPWAPPLVYSSMSARSSDV
jgi:hypothetical protein